MAVSRARISHPDAPLDRAGSHRGSHPARTRRARRDSPTDESTSVGPAAPRRRVGPGDCGRRRTRSCARDPRAPRRRGAPRRGDRQPRGRDHGRGAGRRPRSARGAPTRVGASRRRRTSKKTSHAASSSGSEANHAVGDHRRSHRVGSRGRVRVAAAARRRPHRRRGRPRGRRRSPDRVEAGVRRTARRRDRRDSRGADGNGARRDAHRTHAPIDHRRAARWNEARCRPAGACGARPHARRRPRRARRSGSGRSAWAAAFRPTSTTHSSRCAPLLGAELGATRKVTDEGWLPRARQVGITGRAIAPRLFVSIGASGKFNHTVGMRAARTVLAINDESRRPDLRRRRRGHRRRLA